MVLTDNWVDFQKSEIRNGTVCPSETTARVRVDGAIVWVPSEARLVHTASRGPLTAPDSVSNQGKKKQGVKVIKASENMLTSLKINK